MQTTGLARDIAAEAVRRGAEVNVHELWALLEEFERVNPRVIVDIGSQPAVWWAWWTLGASVVGLTRQERRGLQAFTYVGDSLPSTVIALYGDPADMGTALRVSDQISGRSVDVMVIAGVPSAEVMHHLLRTYGAWVRPGGLIVIEGIANPAKAGAGGLWNALPPAGTRQELIGGESPNGYGIIQVPREVNSNG